MKKLDSLDSRVIAGLTLAALAVHGLPAVASRIECITGASVIADAGGTGIDLSVTGLKLKSKTTTVNFEVYSSDEAVSSPATCVAPDTTVVTCNGFDSTGSVEIWLKCDRDTDLFVRARRTFGLADVPGWVFIDWANIGKDGVSAALNAIDCIAPRAAAEMAGLIGVRTHETEWRADVEVDLHEPAGFEGKTELHVRPRQ